MTHKLLILTSDPATLKWKSLAKKVATIQKTLNKTENGVWEVEVQYRPLTPKVNTNGHIDRAWFNTISYPLFRQGYQHVCLHFSMRQWDDFGIKGSIRGGRHNDTDFVGEMYVRADENTLRGKHNQFEQTILHEIWHELCDTTGVPDTLHKWHTTSFDITKADWVAFDMNNWQPEYQKGVKKIGLLQQVLEITKRLNFLKKKPSKPNGTLAPLVERKAVAIIAEMERLGHAVRIVEGYRSIERQNQLYAQGRTTAGSIVTNARGGESLHNYGVAVDFVFRKEGYNATKKQWDLLGKVGKAQGFEWGGDWKQFVDRPHFELRLGYTLSDFQNNRIDWSKFQ